MNGSQIVKRVVPLLIALVLIIGIAVSCTVLNKDKAIPGIDNPDAIYFEVNEKDRSFSMTRNEIYNLLKSPYGLGRLLDKIDEDLLKAENYYDEVTIDEINTAIEEEIFPDGREGLTDEQIEKEEKTFEEKMYLNTGLRTPAAIQSHFRLALARKKYAMDKLTEYIEEADRKHQENDENKPYFSDEDYENQYKAKYRNGYWTVIVFFSTKTEGETLLKQLGYNIHLKDSSVTNDYNRWVKEVDGEEVTLEPEEIVKAFIDMYNTVNAKKHQDYPGADDNATTIPETIKEDIHYTINEDGKFVFITDDPESEANDFYYSYDDVVKVNSSVENLLRVTLKNYTVDSKVESGKTWYTPTIQSYSNNTINCFVLKLAEEEAPELEDVKDELYQALFDKKITDNFIETEMAKLRDSKGFVIYDEELEASYINYTKSYGHEHKKTKSESKTVVAKVGDKEYSANLLFDLLDERYGMNIALTKINYFRLLVNLDFNNIYDYYLKDAKEADRILDPEKWKEIRQYPGFLRAQFLSNAFASSGYPYTYGWDNFLKDNLNIVDEVELKYFYLHNEIVSQYTEKISSVEDLEEDSELWLLYQEKMEEMIDDYFNVTGVHLLISVNDENGSPTDPEEWTENQRVLAEELFAEVWKYYDSELGTAAEKLEAIANMFSEAPLFLAGRPQTVSAQPQGFDYVKKTDDYEFELAKYKTAGLTLTFQDLGTFGPGRMVKPFEEAVRSMWEADKTSDQATPYGYDEETQTYEPIITEFGYHAYVNLSSTDVPTWTMSDDTSDVIPTLQMVKTYLADSESEYLLDAEGEETEEEFTSAMKTAITTYFEPLKKEISGSNYVIIQLYEELKGLDIEFQSGNYTGNQFIEFVNKTIESYQSNLSYFAPEE